MPGEDAEVASGGGAAVSTPPAGGPSPELGTALVRRVPDICARIIEEWRRSTAGASTSSGDVEEDVRRSTAAGTYALAEYLVSGQEVGRDRSEAWDWTGEAPLSGTISLSGLTKLYLLWREVCSDVVREEAARLETTPETLGHCLEVVKLGFDVSLVRMSKRFEVTRHALEERLAAHQARLEHEALHDPLTGLANRVLLLDRIQHAIDGMSRHSGFPALIYMDLDYFKSVNDSS
ncbi:MAG: diguanylate cyclase, partial [Acidimicrobiales bacterium]